ncbi:MAG: hypothetical protein EA406_09845 [Rhodospirillales bacterium]|nr:MAG: hypothetical protein EA406_09845 [Rhodospirillales bacterium]
MSEPAGMGSFTRDKAEVSPFRPIRSESVADATALVIRRLPALIDRALAVYATAARFDTADEPRAVTAYQAACRSSLDHLQALLMLARTLEHARPDANADADLDRLISDATAAIAAITDTHPG